MTYSILLVVQMPDKSENAEYYARWGEFVKNLRNHTKSNKDIQMLGGSAVLISLQNDLQALCSVVELIPEGLDYKYAIFDEEIEWLPKSKKV
jgi:hypothetical protein